MTPLQLEILLHYHVSRTDYPRLSPPAQQDAITYFLNAGFLTMNQIREDSPADAMQYSPTEKLHVFCEALCRVPEPRKQWIVDFQ